MHSLLVLLVFVGHGMTIDIQKSIFLAVDQLSRSIEGSLEAKSPSSDHDSHTLQSTLHNFRSRAPTIIQSNLDSYAQEKRSRVNPVSELRSFYVAQTVNDLQNELLRPDVKPLHKRDASTHFTDKLSLNTQWGKSVKKLEHQIAERKRVIRSTPEFRQARERLDRLKKEFEEKDRFDEIYDTLHDDDTDFFDKMKKETYSLINEEAKLKQMEKNLEANDATLIKLEEELHAITKDLHVAKDQDQMLKQGAARLKTFFMADDSTAEEQEAYVREKTHNDKLNLQKEAQSYFDLSRISQDARENEIPFGGTDGILEQGLEEIRDQGFQAQGPVGENALVKAPQGAMGAMEESVSRVLSMPAPATEKLMLVPAALVLGVVAPAVLFSIFA